MTTTAKRGRPAQKTFTVDQESIQEPTKKRFSVKRKEREITAKEFKCFSGRPTVMVGQGNTIVFDEELGYNRQLRYCEAEKSIFVDEQSPGAVKTPIIFRMGTLLVRGDQPQLYEFLKLHPANKENGGSLFYEVLPERYTVQEKIDSEFMVSDAINMLREKPLDDILAVAISFGIDIDRSVQEIKYDLLQKLKRNPKGFIEAFDNPVVQMKAKIKQAESLNIIKLSGDGVRWTDSNKMIISVPAGMDPADVFVRYCLTEQASPVVAELEKQLTS